jgi:hypothetical protein
LGAKLGATLGGGGPASAVLSPTLAIVGALAPGFLEDVNDAIVDGAAAGLSAVGEKIDEFKAIDRQMTRGLIEAIEDHTGACGISPCDNEVRFD